MVRKQGNFSRTLANDAKMGAYYTDRGHCRRIGMLVDFPDGEVSVLEPCAGDGAALQAVLEGKPCNAKVFAVELDAEAYSRHLRENPGIAFPLNADFLSGIRASRKAFGFCFANPPYGVDGEGVRLEQRFVEKLYLYLKPQAPMVLVVPHYILRQERFMASFLSRFSPRMEFRFDDHVFRKFQQVALIGERKGTLGCMGQELKGYMEKVREPGGIPRLPEGEWEVKRKVVAVPSPAGAVKEFAALEFDAGEAARHLPISSLYRKAGKAFVPAFVAGELGRPVIPPKPDILYLLAVCGGGQGMVGSEENSDVHLQRGVAKVVESARVEESHGKKGRLVETVRSSTQVELVIIENSGKITKLS